MMGRRVFQLGEVDMIDTDAHDGVGTISVARILERAPNPSLRFVDIAVIPPGHSVGTHTHGEDDEEIYVIVSGEGQMEVDGDQSIVGPGAVIINRPGGTHGLVNTGRGDLTMVVVDIGVDSDPAGPATAGQ